MWVFVPNHVQLFATPWTVAHQVPLSIGFSRQEYWSGLPFPPPGDLPNQGIEPRFLMSPAQACRFFSTSVTWKAYKFRMKIIKNHMDLRTFAECPLDAPQCTRNSTDTISNLLKPSEVGVLISILYVNPTSKFKWPSQRDIIITWRTQNLESHLSVSKSWALLTSRRPSGNIHLTHAAWGN